MNEIVCPHCGGIIDDERSDKSHRLYFSCVNAAFDNLPEWEKGHWATPEELRAWALIETGWYTQETYHAKTVEEAQRFARWLSQQEPRSRVEIDHRVVTIKRARSQRYGKGGMGKKEFSESSDAVLLELSKLIGVDVVLLKTQGLQYGIPEPKQSAHEIPA